MWSGIRRCLTTGVSRFSELFRPVDEYRNPDYGDYNIKKLTHRSTNAGELENCISQVEAARIVGVTKQSMANLVRRGYFTTREVAGRILILRSEAESLGVRKKGRPCKEEPGRKKTSIKSVERTHKEGLEEYISQTEAADIRGVSQNAIADLIRRGRLSAVIVAGRTLVLRSEVEAFVPQPRTGRPPKRKQGAQKPKQKKSKK